MEFEPNSLNAKEEYEENYGDNEEIFEDDEELYEPFRGDEPYFPYMYYMTPMDYDSPMDYDYPMDYGYAQDTRDFYRQNPPVGGGCPITITLERCNPNQRRCTVVIRVSGVVVVRMPVRLENGCTPARGEAILPGSPNTRVGVEGQVCVDTRRREICFRGMVFRRRRVSVGCPMNCRWSWRRQNLCRVTRCRRY